MASAGQYDVTARWIGQGSPATVVYRIQHANGTAVVTVSPSATGTLALGAYRFLPGVNYAVSLDSAEGTGVAVADAVSLTPQEAGFNIFPDQLGTPRVITDANGQEVWRWALDDPFGPNPAVGSLEMPLRFPGQVRDSETGMHYNGFRDYEPNTGRYVQSDPMGLRAGINTYAYVESDPLRSSDPSGLVKWTGSFTGGAAIEVVGIGIFRYSLKSECINGKQGFASGWAFGGAAGLGITLSGSISASTFHDFNSTPDPYVFDGSFTYIGAGVSVAAAKGRMYASLGYTALLLLGGASAEAGPGTFNGIDFSAAFIAGSSIVTDARVVNCGCTP